MTFIRYYALLFLAVTLGFFTISSSAQRHGRSLVYPNKPKPVLLRVEGHVPNPLSLSLEDFRLYPRSTTQIAQNGGETYEGVALSEILRRAGAPIDGGRDKAEMRMCVEVISRNGPRVVFSLAELDPAFVDSNVIVADMHNGGSFDPNVGLFLVAGSDKIQLRSVEHVLAIRVRRLR
jgi:hypothetical protein